MKLGISGRKLPKGSFEPVNSQTLNTTVNARE